MFYHYNQNNTGGSFDVDENLTQHVIIEADSGDEADEKLIELGGYFNGCEEDLDCPCCGDRWYPQWSDDATESPEVYGKSPEDYVNDKNSTIWCDPEIIVHYKDGRKAKYGRVKK